MDDVQGDIDGDPEEQTEDEIVIIPVKDNRTKTVKGFSNNIKKIYILLCFPIKSFLFLSLINTL